MAPGIIQLHKGRGQPTGAQPHPDTVLSCLTNCQHRAWYDAHKRQAALNKHCDLFPELRFVVQDGPGHPDMKSKRIQFFFWLFPSRVFICGSSSGSMWRGDLAEGRARRHDFQG